MSSLNANQRGIVAILACSVAYSVNDALMKQIIKSYPIGEMIFIRGAIGLTLLGAAVLALGYGPQLRASLGRTLVARSLFDGLSTTSFIAALSQMPIANLAAVLQFSPMLITALSVLAYREAVGWRRWSAIAVGFAGAMLVIKPTPSGFDAWSLLGIVAALCAALREMTNRRVDPGTPTLVIAFWGVVGITALGSLFGLVEEWRAVPPIVVLQTFVAATFVATATYLTALGFRNVDLSVVAPFRYSYLLTSALAGFIAFGEWPDALSAAGAVLIVASGVYALHREQVRQRDLTGRATPAA